MLTSNPQNYFKQIKNPNSNCFFPNSKFKNMHVTLVILYLSSLTTNHRWNLTSTDVCIASLFLDGWRSTGMKMEGSPSLFPDRLSFWWNWSKKITKQFATKDNTNAMPAVCGKNMRRKYQELRLIFTLGPSQPQDTFSCNFFYWSARVRWD